METNMSDEMLEKRLKRAKETHWLLAVTGPNEFAIRGKNSENAHLIMTKGVDALECSCPDYRHTVAPNGKCKHMIAYEEWFINEVVG